MWKPIALLFAAALTQMAGADLNDELFAAARKGETATVQALLEKGAGLEATTPYGQTPLYLAAISGHEDTVRLLLEKGAKTNIRDTFYKAPMLAFVLSRKHYAVAKLLIEKGDNNADETLEGIAPAGRADLVEALLGKTKPSQAALDKAYEIALSGKSTDLAAVLEKAGAKPPAPGVTIDPKVLDSYAGTYKTEQFPLDIKVFVREGKLFAQATGQSEFAPKAKSEKLFEFAPAQLQLEFDAPGSMILRQGGQTIAFKKAVTQ